MLNVTRMLRVVSAAVAVAASGIAVGAEGACSVVLVSKPQGATITMDGKEIGTTPLSLYGQPSGAHDIEMTLEGYPKWWKHVTFHPGFNTVSATLETESTTPARSAEPEAEAQPDSAADDEPEKTEEVPKYIEIDCLFCQGAGLMRTIGCFKCAAAGYVQGVNELVACAVCGGTARTAYTCTECQGEGELPTTTGRKVECPRCKGKGAFPCTACRGSGKTRRPNPASAKYDTQPCEHCQGTGCVLLAKCKRCGGKGETLRANQVNEVVTVTTAKCVECKGKGESPNRCSRCSGKGYLGSRQNASPCVACAATGCQYPRCPYCRGAGWTRAPRQR
jgi:DnaJ-class molecular chaperone